MRFSLLLLLLLMGTAASGPAETLGASYYLDCANGRDSASGNSSTSAWRSLERLQSTTFRPGDRILLRRGTKCTGMLAPRGSGAPGAPVVLDAYGSGPLPRIEGGTNEAAIK